MPKGKAIPFPEVITALLDTSQPFSPTYLHRFSDLTKKDLRELKAIWKKIDPMRRLSLLSDLEEMADVDTLMNFDELAHLGLKDPDGNIRAQAAGMLWEDNSVDLARTLFEMVKQDPDIQARAAAAAALGKFIFLGEVEEIPAKILHNVEECLLKAAQGSDDPLVRRRATEALGFSSRPEVPLLIRTAYDSQQTDWVASALMAMGRSYDQTWEADVNRQLRAPKADVQIEAVKAAGELGLESAKRSLLDLLEDESTDTEIRAEVIWALSEIGGEEVREALTDYLEKTDDEDETTLVNEAIENLTLNEQIESLDLFDIDLEEEARSGHVIDISNTLPTDEPGTIANDSPEGGTENTDKKKSRPRHKKS
jgi:HEAT repeat protein